MRVHEIKNKDPEKRKIKVGEGGKLRTYRCLKDNLEFAGYVLKKGDQVVSSEPKCGKGTSLVSLTPEAVEKGQKPAFELVKEMVEVDEDEDDEDDITQDEDPRTKAQIALDIFQISGEKISPARLLRVKKKDLLLDEKRALIERDKDGLTAVIDEKVM